MKTLRLSTFFLVVIALILSACSSATTATPTTSAPTTAATQVNAPATEAAPATTSATSAATEAVSATAPATVSAAQSSQGCLGTAQDAVVDLNCRTITIAVENAYLPFNYVEISTGKAGGWDYDAWTEICTRLHCTPELKEASWDSLIQSVANKQYDAGADGITNTPDRAKEVDFSDGYMKIQQRLLVRKGETRFNSIEAFAADSSLILGAQSSSTNYETAKKFVPEDRISASEQVPFLVQSLISGDVDAVIVDEVVGMGYQGENADKLELIGPAISSDELGFIFPKGSDLVAPVNAAIKAMQADGTLSKLNEKYFGSDFKLTSGDIQ